MSEMTNDVTQANDESVTLPDEATKYEDPTLDSLVERVTGLKAEKEAAEATAAELAEKVSALQTSLREAQFEARRATEQADSKIIDFLKEKVADGTFEMDDAKEYAEALGVDSDALTTKYEVTVTITVRVSGVVAENEDEAGDNVAENISVDLSSYGIEYDSLDQEDVQVDSVDVES